MCGSIEDKFDASVAQLDSASGFYPQGWGFKSLQMYHLMHPWHSGCAPAFQAGYREFNSHRMLQFNY